MVFQEFWPRYLAALSDPRTRTLHVTGTLAGSAPVVSAPAAGYGPAWISHALIERNKPQTFRAPFSGLPADYLMAYHVLRGTIDGEIAAAAAR